MLKVFTTEQIRELDQYTIQHEPVQSIDLVERASIAFVREFTRQFSKQFRVVVFAGRGNNGADALAIARLLTEETYQVETFLFNPSGILSPECEENKQRLLALEEALFVEVTNNFDPPALTNRDVLIDGLFGTGLTRPLTGGFAAVIDYINQSAAKVVSIDIPSGLFGEDNHTNNMDAVVKADKTFSFGFPKVTFFLSETAEYVGEWKVLDIGLHPDGIEQMEAKWTWVTENDIAASFRPRKRFAHKGTFGHALLIAGSRGKMGAAILSARACLRGGVGLLTVHIPQRGELPLQTTFPEAMISLDIHNNHFSSVPEIAAFSAIGIGPGIGQHLETSQAFERLLLQVKKPMVVDADGLNILAANSEFLRLLPANSILTPHPKEFDRLVGEVAASSYDRLQKARALATKYSLIVVLKGAYTAICLPDGVICFNCSGNPGMATAGSGDVLTGIVLSLLAQGYEPKDAAVMGVWLHGAAGDLAAAFHSEESMVAGDIIEMQGKAFKQLK